MNNKVDLKQFYKDYQEIIKGNFTGEISDILPIVKQNEFKELFEKAKESNEKFKDINMESIFDSSPLHVMLLLTFMDYDTFLKF